MFSPELIQMAVLLLVSLAVGGVVYTFAAPYFNGEKKTNKRVAELSSDRRRRVKAAPEQKRRKAVQEVLDEIDQRHRADKKVTLKHRLHQAGLKLTPGGFYGVSVASAIALAIAAFIISGNKYAAIGGLFVGGLGLPRWVIGFMARKRQNKFLDEFANAIDIIVRGVRTGLPLNDCIRIIAQESPEPVGSEFSQIVEEQRIGVPLSQGIERLYERMPLQEVNFLSIVVSIQSSAGGNLAEALSNLSTVLRERKKLQGKVRAFSQEAKSSAMIIGALPLLVMGAVYFARPDYIEILFGTDIGNMMLVGSGIWMMIGVLIMKKMINFDY